MLGMRELQKYAVKMGGGTNHRQNLADQILIKNNHLHLTNGVRIALERCRGRGRVQVEVGSIEDFAIALEMGVDAVLLDNMSVEDVRKCVVFGQGKAFLEASGGITMEKVADYAATGVDAISIGALTHSAPALDIAFRIR
jgi:nicotinate-nucleotide pyrophosphorylase (carboxylating)